MAPKYPAEKREILLVYNPDETTEEQVLPEVGGTSSSTSTNILSALDQADSYAQSDYDDAPPPTYDESTAAYADASAEDAPAHSRLVEKQRVRPQVQTTERYENVGGTSSQMAPLSCTPPVPLEGPFAPTHTHSPPSVPPTALRDTYNASPVSFCSPSVYTVSTATLLDRSSSLRSDASCQHSFAPSQSMPPPSSPLSTCSTTSYKLPPPVQPSISSKCSSRPVNVSTPRLSARVMCPNTPGSLTYGLKGLMSSGNGVTQLLTPPPPSFTRVPPLDRPYTPFAPCALHSHSRRMEDGFPALAPPAPQPHPFSTHDVNEADWLTFLGHVKRAGTMPTMDVGHIVTNLAPRALGLNVAAGMSWLSSRVLLSG